MISILKGDTSDSISLTLADGYDYTDATVEVRYQSAVRHFSGCAAGDTVTFSFTAAETRAMALGAFPVTVRIATADGGFWTIHNSGVRINVTNTVGEVHSGGAIVITASGILKDVTTLPERYREKDMRDKLNEIITKCGGKVLALLAVMAMPFAAWAYGVSTATKEDIYSDEQVVTNVDFSGIVDYGEVTNIADSAVTRGVPAWAREAVAPESAPNYAAVSNAAMTALQSYSETDPTVPAWAKATSAPIPDGYATVSNAAMSALQSFTESDPTVPAWAKSTTPPVTTETDPVWDSVKTNYLQRARQWAHSGREITDGLGGGRDDIYIPVVVATTGYFVHTWSNGTQTVVELTRRGELYYGPMDWVNTNSGERVSIEYENGRPKPDCYWGVWARGYFDDYFKCEYIYYDSNANIAETSLCLDDNYLAWMYGVSVYKSGKHYQNEYVVYCGLMYKSKSSFTDEWFSLSNWEQVTIPYKQTADALELKADKTMISETNETFFAAVSNVYEDVHSPAALTIVSGSVTNVYDGSVARTVEVKAGGAGDIEDDDDGTLASLGISGGTVGAVVLAIAAALLSMKRRMETVIHYDADTDTCYIETED